MTEAAAWAETLEWRTNERDLDQIIRAVIARLDCMFREEYGVRVDQVSDAAELWTSAAQSAAWYKQADERYRHLGIYSHLHSGLEQLLGKRARRLVGQRRTGGTGT
jgi:hypothetical protein